MAGINCDTQSLTDGTCNMQVYETLWSVSPKNRDLKELSQDFVGGFTMFIWFVVFVALVYSWFLMILWWADEKKFETWKKWVIYSIIGLLLVWGSYGIIILIQLIAKW